LDEERCYSRAGGAVTGDSADGFTSKDGEVIPSDETDGEPIAKAIFSASRFCSSSRAFAWGSAATAFFFFFAPARFFGAYKPGDEESKHSRWILRYFFSRFVYLR